MLTYSTGGPGTRPSPRTDRRYELRVTKRLQADTIERLVAEYRAGSTAADLGRHYGIAKTTVLRLIREAGEPVRHPRLSTSETACLVDLYEAGSSQRDIADRLGKSRSVVWHGLRRAGLVGLRPKD